MEILLGENILTIHGICSYCNTDIIQIYVVQHKNYYLVCSCCVKSSSELRIEEPMKIPTLKQDETIIEYQIRKAKEKAASGLKMEEPMNTIQAGVAQVSKAASDKVGTGLLLIPLYSLLAIGKIFIEGLRYGKDNWKKGVRDKEYQEERLEHALLHLIKYKEGDRTESHLAKIAWFCFTQIELERLEDMPTMPQESPKEKIDHIVRWELIIQDLLKYEVRLNLERLRKIYSVPLDLDVYEACDYLRDKGILPFSISS